MEELIFCILWVILALPTLTSILKYIETLSAFEIICITTLGIIGGPFILIASLFEVLIGIFINDECWEKFADDYLKEIKDNEDVDK